MNRTSIILIALLILNGSIYAQEILPLKSNNVLKAFLKENPDEIAKFSQKALNKTNSAFDSLPFFEDFTKSNILPDPAKWVDRNVFINNSFGINPPSYNVATFDGLDRDGNAYKLSTGFSYGPADTLTSVPLDFSNYSAANNIYFSFFYERGGLGVAPANGDSLLLQFFTFGGNWNTVWSKPGGSTETKFTQVIVPINAPDYFHGAFQFRFVNYANHTGNMSVWNIDYIRIDRNRNLNDSLNTDVTVMTTPTPILKRYYRMPWKQFAANPSAEMAASTSYFIRNLNNTNVQVSTKNFMFNQKQGNLLSANSFLLGSLTYTSPQKISYTNTTRIDTIAPANTDTVIVRNIYTASENADVRRNNDTFYRDQLFANYYAYDDGTAEAGYGISNGSGKVALGFETNTPDTLRAIDIYFNQSDVTNSLLAFTMTVWSYLTPVGQPAIHDVIQHYQTVVVPEHNYSYRTSMGGFTRYILDTPRLIPKGKFFIGWRQSSSYLLNVGFDFNYPDNFGTANNPEMYVNVSGKWEISAFPGTVMMRPVMGKSVVITGVAEARHEEKIKVYPNPAHSLLYLDMQPQEGMQLDITDMQGREIRHCLLEDRVINIADLAPGIYILNIFDTLSGEKFTTKFTVQ
jgi:hypothetical protein